jgi:hypothetical protein
MNPCGFVDLIVWSSVLCLCAVRGEDRGKEWGAACTEKHHRQHRAGPHQPQGTFHIFQVAPVRRSPLLTLFFDTPAYCMSVLLVACLLVGGVGFRLCAAPTVGVCEGSDGAEGPNQAAHGAAGQAALQQLHCVAGVHQVPQAVLQAAGAGRGYRGHAVGARCCFAAPLPSSPPRTLQGCAMVSCWSCSGGLRFTAAALLYRLAAFLACNVCPCVFPCVICLGVWGVCGGVCGYVWVYGVCVGCVWVCVGCVWLSGLCCVIAGPGLPAAERKGVRLVAGGA